MARKILLADDSVTAQNMGRKILTDAGYEVVTVNNGSAALKKIAEGKPDLIVLDVYMPGYSGLEVCQRIKENAQTARIPILLTVGKLEPFKPEEARRARADAFVVKPFEASELLSALTKLEDKIIPQAEPYKQGRFAKAVASVDSEPDGEKFGDTDDGWKARLRIPTGKPKPKNTEPDVDYVATQGKGFRDLDPLTKKSPPPPPVPTAHGEFERPVPAGLPHDITPEEIAAITAAAEQLKGGAATKAAAPASAVESAGVPSESPRNSADISGPVESPTTSDEGNSYDAVAESAPVTFASSPQMEEAPASVPSQVPAIASVPDRPEPESLRESAAGAVAPVADSAPVETATSPAAPMDQVAEAPEHPSAASEEAQVPVEQSDASAIAIPEAEAMASPADIASASETASVQADPPAVEPIASGQDQENAAGIPADPAVADDEVMAALQTLMPSETANDLSSPSDSAAKDSQRSAFAGLAPAENVPQAHAAGPRWIAEEITLAASEITVSLQKEMEKAYAAVAGEGAMHSAAASHEASGPLTEAVADAASTNVPATGETNAVYAMATAAAAGDGTPIVAAISTQSLTESSPVADVGEGPAAHEAKSLEIPAVAETLSGTTDIVGGDIMAASWKNIRDSIAGAAAKPAPLKEEFPDPALESPEVGVASEAAAGERASSQVKASDPRAIASIVDSVLAELRPKIVEEIARKLADPKKD